MNLLVNPEKLESRGYPFSHIFGKIKKTSAAWQEKKGTGMQLTIYHTNDIHSDYGFLKKVHSYLKRHRNTDDLYFDSGDYADLKSTLVQADQGKSAMELLGLCGLTAMTVGNNECDPGYDALRGIAQTGFPILCANITDNDGSAVSGLASSLLLERQGKRFLIIGLAPYYKKDMAPDAYNLFFEMGNLRTTDPIPAVRRELEKHKGQFDFCIALSHSGLGVDRVLMERLPEIDLWLGGHSHSVYCDDRYSTSGKGEYLGRITLELGAEIRVMESIQLELSEEDDKEFDALLREKEAHAHRILSRELEIREELEFDPFRECALTNFLCDCLRKQFGGDLAVMHGGISEKSLTRPVSNLSLIETFPSKLNPTIYPIRGENLLEAIRLSFDENYIRESGAGAGFRGSVLGNLGFSSNVTVTKEPFRVTISGEEVLPEHTYTLVTDDYLQRGTGYPSLAVPDGICSYDKWFIRDMVRYFLTDPEVFASAKIKRVWNDQEEAR